MISLLHGTLVERYPTRIVLDVGGVGYELAIPLSTYDTLPGLSKHARLLTYLHVRDDALQLYGFSTGGEKQLFLQLIAVSGVGPKVALGILSSCTAEEFASYVRAGSVAALKALPGIGKKTAERLILELRDKVGGAGTSDAEAGLAAAAGPREQAALALVSLGYRRANIDTVLHALQTELPEADVEQLIKLALQRL